MDRQGLRRDRSGGRNWEWTDQVVKADEWKILDAIVSGTECRVRFHGQNYYADHTISGAEKQAITRAVAAFRATESQMKARKARQMSRRNSRQ